MQALRNTVPVPRHWSQKRKYLQGKRGIEKPPFKLPEFIEATGKTVSAPDFSSGMYDKMVPCQATYASSSSG